MELEGIGVRYMASAVLQALCHKGSSGKLGGDGGLLVVRRSFLMGGTKGFVERP